MTPAQLAALQSYISSVVRVMTDHIGAHNSNMTLYFASRAKLEKAFGKPLPKSEYPDLFADAPSGLPDIL